MSLSTAISPLRHADRFFIGGEWVAPSSDATIEVIDSGTEELFFNVAEAQEADMARAVGAARQAFDDGPWPKMTHAERAEYLRALGAGLATRGDEIGQIWPRESGVLHRIAQAVGNGAAGTFDYYAGLADTFEWEREAQPTGPGFGLLVHEPVGVVGAIIPWNAPISLISYKIAPALIAGCTVVLKSSPEAPGEGYLVGEVAEDDRAASRASSTCSPPTARSRNYWCATRGSTRSPSPDQPPPAAGSPRCVASGSPAAPSSSGASRLRWSWTTPTSTSPLHGWRRPSA